MENNKQAAGKFLVTKSQEVKHIF